MRASTINFGQIDSAVALMLALFVNAAILIASAAVLRRSGRSEMAETQDAYRPFSQSCS